MPTTGHEIIDPNEHAAVVRFAEAHPGFDEATTRRIDQIRVARNAGMYGDRHDDSPAEYSPQDAALLLEAGTNVVNRVSSLVNAGRPIPPPPSLDGNWPSPRNRGTHRFADEIETDTSLRRTPA